MKIVSECCGAETKYVKLKFICTSCNKPCKTVENFDDENDDDAYQGEEQHFEDEGPFFEQSEGFGL